ncbi:hypothetical protein ACFOWA_15175 [Pedobacter lithocola]|uniref:AraC-type arabinose-binding/dimerisation domain-containing protein n=1 Tax=Pedobacter lithocola TaxID=1908239 RepID=A0ABV8PEQ4_9SPHI
MNTSLEKEDTPSHLKAIHLFNKENDDCDFETGKIPVKQHIKATYFFSKTDVSTLENIPHPAPRRQFVITIKGKLKFTVTSGKTFIIQPGIILIANDTKGIGHTWEIIDGDEWERIYIPLGENDEDYFTAD